MRAASLLLLLVVAAVAAPGLAAADSSVVINPGEQYTTHFFDVDVSANDTVTFELSYVSSDNSTSPFLSLSGISFSYNSSEPLLLTIKNDGSSPVNVTFNKLTSDLASSGQATITASDRVVRIPVSAKTGDTITVTISSVNDPWVRLVVVVAEYSDGTYERVDGGSYYYGVKYSKYFGSDSDWPASIDGNYYTDIHGSRTISFTAKKDVTAVIVALPTYLDYKWDVSVSVSSNSDNGGSSTTDTTTDNTNIADWLNSEVDLFGHKASMVSIVVAMLFLLLLVVVLLRR